MRAPFTPDLSPAHEKARPRPGSITAQAAYRATFCLLSTSSTAAASWVSMDCTSALELKMDEIQLPLGQDD